MWPLLLDEETNKLFNFYVNTRTKIFNFYLKLMNNYYFILISIDIWNKYLEVRKGNIEEITNILRYQRLDFQ